MRASIFCEFRAVSFFVSTPPCCNAVRRFQHHQIPPHLWGSPINLWSVAKLTWSACLSIVLCQRFVCISSTSTESRQSLAARGLPNRASVSADSALICQTEHAVCQTKIFCMPASISVCQEKNLCARQSMMGTRKSFSVGQTKFLRASQSLCVASRTCM